MKYGVAIWYVEWISEDGMEEECSYAETLYFDTKKEMEQHKKAHQNDEDYRYEYYKIEWL